MHCLHVFRLGVTVVDDTTTGLELFSIPSWETWRLTLSPSPDTNSVSKLDVPALAGGIRYYSVGGEAYQNNSALDFSTTQLQRTSGNGAPEPGVTVPGIPYTVFRLR